MLARKEGTQSIVRFVVGWVLEWLVVSSEFGPLNYALILNFAQGLIGDQRNRS